MSIRNLVFGINSVTVSYLIRHNSKLRQMLLQNAIATLLQNATEVYNKMRHFHYKMRQFAENAVILLQNATLITKCNFYYKL